MSRRALVIGGAVLAAGLITFLVLQGDAAQSADDVATGSGAAAYNPEDALSAEGAANEMTPDEPATAPALKGSQDPVDRTPQDVTLQVVSQGGMPVPQAAVALIRGDSESGELSRVDKDGKVTFADVVLGDARVTVAAQVNKRAVILARDVAIRKPSQIIWVKQLRRVVRTFRNADTGERIPIESAKVWDDLADQLIESPGPVSSVTAWDFEREIGRTEFVRRIVPPPGWIEWEKERWLRTLSAYADEIEVEVPLRREVTVRLAVRDHKGEATSKAEVLLLRVAGRDIRNPKTSVDGFGNVSVHGVPFFRREKITLNLGIPKTSVDEWVDAYMGTDPEAPVQLNVQLTEPFEYDDDDIGWEPGSETIGIGGGAGRAFGGRQGNRAEPAKRSTLEVRVERWNGNPAVGADVRVAGAQALTDEHGIARFVDIAAGRHTIKTTQPGLRATTGVVEVGERGTSEVTLREQAGAILKLHVVDDQGVGLPYARYQLGIGRRDHEHIEEFKGIQRVDTHLDHEGRIVLSHVDPRVNTVTVMWGSRRQRIGVALKSGQVKGAVIVLKADKDAPER